MVMLPMRGVYSVNVHLFTIYVNKCVDIVLCVCAAKITANEAESGDAAKVIVDEAVTRFSCCLRTSEFWLNMFHVSVITK